MNFRSWGNYPKIKNSVYHFKRLPEAEEILSSLDDLIPYGNGRSYGDSALNKNIIHFKSYSYLLGFDESQGILHCQAGALLSEILDVFIPRGWFLWVTPGTKLITVGGAIASDVHGKNHHVAGSFSDSIIEFKLLLPNGDLKICSRTENIELFKATCGGMGLTGFIMEAKIRLLPIKSSVIRQKMIKTENLKETFEAFSRYKQASYSVAWIDCLAKGEAIGRCLLMIGEHAEKEDLEYRPKKGPSVPVAFPSFVLNAYSVKVFNTLYYGRVRKKQSVQLVDIDKFFYPLDSIDHWNRIYGKTGFIQYQFVLPTQASYTGLKEILRLISDSGKGSFLAVLKLFGNNNENWLSFPMEGYTLALDFKIEPGLFELLDKLDKIVLACGGRFYLAKDARVKREVFEAGYEYIDKFRGVREDFKLSTKINSLQSKRLGI